MRKTNNDSVLLYFLRYGYAKRWLHVVSTSDKCVWHNQYIDLSLFLLTWCFQRHGKKLNQVQISNFNKNLEFYLNDSS